MFSREVNFIRYRHVFGRIRYGTGFNNSGSTTPWIKYGQCCGSGIRCLFTPGSGMGKKSKSGSGMNIPDHISECLETVFWPKILKFFDADPDPGSGSGIFFDPASGIRDGKNSDPDPQH
jgi:hypothetical protein